MGKKKLKQCETISEIKTIAYKLFREIELNEKERKQIEKLVEKRDYGLLS